MCCSPSVKYAPVTREVAPRPARSFWIHVLPLREPKPPATQSSSASRATRAWCEAKCHVSRERFWIETYSSFDAGSQKSSETTFVVRVRARATTTRTPRSARSVRPPRRRRAGGRRASRPRSSSRSGRRAASRARARAGRRRAGRAVQRARLCAANFSSPPTSVPSRSCAVSGSKTTPSGARSISIPPSLTRASPATSTSSIPSATAAAAAVAPFAVNESGSKPRRSVKRQCSSVVVGSGSAS